MASSCTSLLNLEISCTRTSFCGFPGYSAMRLGGSGCLAVKISPDSPQTRWTKGNRGEVAVARGYFQDGSKSPDSGDPRAQGRKIRLHEFKLPLGDDGIGVEFVHRRQARSN
jgi:hypothetical protein